MSGTGGAIYMLDTELFNARNLRIVDVNIISPSVAI